MTVGAMEGLFYCGNILLPSLFPFAVFSALAVKSGFAESFGKLFTSVTRKLFHTDGTVGTVILLGFAGGFPIGAKGVATLYEEHKISKETAQSLTMFTVGGGVGFTVTVIGISFYRNIYVGLILWGCQIISQTVLGIIACRKIVFKPVITPEYHKKPLSVCIVESTQSGVESMLSLCGMVILFSCVFGILENLKIVDYTEWLLEKLTFPLPVAKSMTGVLWEVTKGCNNCLDYGCPLWLISFALGWGGICVHFQIYSIAHALEIPKMKFMFYRFMQGILSALLTYVIFTFYNPVLNVYTTVSYHSNSVISTPHYTGSMALIGMSLLFIISCHSKQAKT